MSDSKWRLVWLGIGTALLLTGGALSDGWPTVDYFTCTGLWFVVMAIAGAFERAWIDLVRIWERGR